MNSSAFTTTILVDQSPEEVFEAINNVRGWWSGEVEGMSDKQGAEFTYTVPGIHYSKQKVTEFIPGKKIVWKITDATLSFISNKSEWKGTNISFDISEIGGRTEIRFTHVGLSPAFECYNDCSNAWGLLINGNLKNLIASGEQQPSPWEKTIMTTSEIATRFNELAQQEKWFEIQDELFAENVKSIDPPSSPYFGYAEGKANIREKGMDWVKRITAAHKLHTTEPVVSGNHFAVGREVDITVDGFGRIQINEIMLYQVKDGQIILEQFFY